MATYQQLIAPSNYYRLNVSITQVSQDIVNNTSLVRVVGSITGMSSYATASYTRSINSVNIDGVTYTPTTAYSLANGKTVQIFSYERTVSHATDGKKKVSVSWTFTGGDTASSWNPRGTINCSQDMSQIARASTASLSTSTVDYGGAFTVNIDRKSTSFTHTVTVKSAQGNTLTYTNVGTSQGVTIPTSWLDSFTNGSATSGTVSVQTYSGSTAIGSAVSLGFTINVPRGSTSLSTNQTSYGDTFIMYLNKAHSTLSSEMTVTFPGVPWIHTVTASSYSFTVPLEWMNYFTTGTNATVNISIQTKNGSTNIGSPMYHTLYCYVPDYVVPSVSVTRTAFNSGLSGFHEPIQGISTMTLTRNTSTSYSAPISKTEWWGDGIASSSASTVSFTAMQKNPQYIYCRVTDSRGRKSVTATYTSWNHAYSPPNLHDITNLYRCLSTGAQSNEGTYCRMNCTYSYTSLSGVNKLTMREYINCSPAWNWTHTSLPASGAQLGPSGGGALDRTQTYLLTITITDSLGRSSSLNRRIPVAEVLMNFPDSANALGIGQYSLGPNRLDIGWETYIKGFPIMEEISNSNGMCYKFYNGTMIWTHNYSADITFTANSSLFYGGVSTIHSFVVPFTGTPNVVISIRTLVGSTGYGACTPCLMDVTSSHVGNVGFYRSFAGSASINYNLVALGRWKE